MNTTTQNEYLHRMNQVLDYIDENLSEDITLNDLAKVAHFSSFHFHRIFSAMVGETPNKFLLRVRLEKAATFLIQNPEKSITEITYDCGFKSSSVFSRSFKKLFNKTPSQWRKEQQFNYFNNKFSQLNSKIGQTSSKDRKASTSSLSYSKREMNNYLKRRKKMDLKIQAKTTIQDLQEVPVAYVRHIGPYKGDQQLFEVLFQRLMSWAGPRDLLRFPGSRFFSVYHDNPDITEEDKLRLSVCLSVPSETKVEGDIGKMAITGGKYALTTFEILPHEYEAAWDYVFGTWLPQSGFQPDDRSCFEEYLNDPKSHPEGKHIVSIGVPVKPL